MFDMQLNTCHIYEIIQHYMPDINKCEQIKYVHFCMYMLLMSLNVTRLFSWAGTSASGIQY